MGHTMGGASPPTEVPSWGHWAIARQGTTCPHRANAIRCGVATTTGAGAATGATAGVPASRATSDTPSSGQNAISLVNFDLHFGHCLFRGRSSGFAGLGARAAVNASSRAAMGTASRRCRPEIEDGSIGG